MEIMKFINYKNIISSCASIALLLFSTFAVAESQLTKLNVNPLVDGKFELKFEFDDAISAYKDKLNYRPNQLVIDVEDASSVLKLNPIEIDKSGIESVEANRTSEGLRLIIALDTLMPYRILQESNNLIVRFGEVSEQVPATDSEAALASAIIQDTGDQTAQVVVDKSDEINVKSTSTESAKGYVNTVSDIDFKRGSEGQGKLFVYLDNSSVAVDIRRRDQQLIAEFQSTFIPDELLYIMDVVDFATAVEKVETFREDGKTRFVFDIKDEYNYRYDQLDTLFMIEVSEKPKDETESVYQGKAISLEFPRYSCTYCFTVNCRLQWFQSRYYGFCER